MPRIPHSALLKAYNISPLLPLVLRGTRDLPSAINELRWLREHVAAGNELPLAPQPAIWNLCKRRESGEPLQYILGSQPFGDLDIKCRRGVLIPRPETEAYTSYVVNLLHDGSLHPSLSSAGATADRRLNILDLCSGTGCISLLLAHLIPNATVTGWDISPTAISLSRDNLRRNKSILANSSSNSNANSGPKSEVSFEKVDIFDPQVSQSPSLRECDIIISNPPYISQRSYDSGNDTTRSVRNWEPRLALVPCISSTEKNDAGMREDEGESGAVRPEDVFYERIIELYRGARCKVLIMEVGDEEQALRVAEMVGRTFRGGESSVEIWRDWPDADRDGGEVETVLRDVVVRGEGKMRSVIVRNLR